MRFKMHKVDSNWSIICLGTQLIGQEGFKLNRFVREFIDDQKRASKNKERGGYIVEISRMAEGNVTVNLIVA